MTKPTRDLIGVLLADYQRIHKEKHETKLFTQKDVDAIMQKTHVLEFGQAYETPLPFTLHNAGHVLGSAMIRIDAKGGLLYTGDICMRKTRVLDRAELGITAHTLLVENTYGARTDILPPAKETALSIVDCIKETLTRGGHVLIPSFAVGRGQEILLMLDDYMRSGLLPKTRIYVDGMIRKAMRIYRHNAYYASEDIKKRILMSEDDPFKSENFHTSRSLTKDDVLTEPSIIVTTSGMLSGGPVLTYLERLSSNPANTIIFVGYQAEGTLGQQILKGAKKIKIHEGTEEEKELDVTMQVREFRMSGHADYNELLQFITSVKGLKRVVLLHGEKTDLKDALGKKYEVVIPQNGETIEV